MRKQRYSNIMRCCIIGLVAIVFSGQAKATLMVNIGGTISGGAVVGGITYTDNGPEMDVNPALGVLDIAAWLNSVAIRFGFNGFSTTSGTPAASLTLTANQYTGLELSLIHI